MKRNTKDELRFPVNLQGGSVWYFVEERFVHVLADSDSGVRITHIKIPRKRLERLLRIKP